MSREAVSIVYVFNLIACAVGASIAAAQSAPNNLFTAAGFKVQYADTPEKHAILRRLPPDKLVTSGPWRVEQYVAGEKTVLGRNPHWFGVDSERHRLPYLDEVVFLVVDTTFVASFLRVNTSSLHLCRQR